MQDAVRIDVEGHLGLRHSARSGRDALEVELSQALVPRGHVAFTLQHVNRHRRLIVVGGRKDLLRLRRNGRVLLDELGGNASERFDAEGQGRHVEEQDVLDVAFQYAALDTGADGDGLVRIDVFSRLLAEEILHRLLDLGHARHTADEDHILDVGNLEPCVLQRDAARLDGFFDQVLDQALEFRPGDLDREVLRSALVGCDVGQVDLGLLTGRELDLGFLRGLLEALQRENVVPEVDALLLLEFVAEIIDKALVEVLAAQERVAVGRQHLELVFAFDLCYLDDGDIERAAAQIVHRDLSVALLLIQAEGQRGGGRLVDDPLDFQTRDATGVLGRLALSIVEIGGDRDHGFGALFAQVVLGGFLHFAKHLRRDFGRRDFLAADLDPRVAVVRLDYLVGHQIDVFLYLFLFELAPDEPLDCEQGVLGIGDGLPLGGRAYEDLAVLHVRDDRRRSARAFGVLDDFGLPALHDRDAGVGRPEIDSNDLSHDLPLNVRILRITWKPIWGSSPRLQAWGSLGFATVTSAGRMTRSWRQYPFWRTLITALGSFSDGSMLIAWC